MRKTKQTAAIHTSVSSRKRTQRASRSIRDRRHSFQNPSHVHGATRSSTTHPHEMDKWAPYINMSEKRWIEQTRARGHRHSFLNPLYFLYVVRYTDSPYLEITLILMKVLEKERDRRALIIRELGASSICHRVVLFILYFPRLPMQPLRARHVQYPRYPVYIAKQIRS